ncbi:MAG: GPR endopeptidase [Lachnospiraceae bacterium]|nr:GPR endopeptidase [Lachnospiraceae bacterium]
MNQEIRTDLALEVKERFQEDNVEVKGVVLEEQEKADGKIRISTVEITDRHGAQVMRKPIGRYVTLEMQTLLQIGSEEQEMLSSEVGEQLRQLLRHKGCSKVLVVGLGNREVTPDSLGPRVADQLLITRHLLREYGSGFLQKNLSGMAGKKEVELSAVAPGVMAQTGMEAVEIVQGIVREIQPDLVIAIDALAARSVARVTTTVQLTDTGICPGAGIGNNRRALNEESIGCPVIAIGVPTVVDAATIVRDSMEQLLQEQGYSKREIELFLESMDSMKGVDTMFVTPKSIDEAIGSVSEILAEGINQCFFFGSEA